MPLVVTQLRVTAEFQAVLFGNSDKGVTYLNHIILTYFSVGHELKFRHYSSAVICQYVRRFYYILLTVTYGLVCSMITYLFQMYLILMIY